MISIYIAGGVTMQPYLLKSKLITIITSSSNTFLYYYPYPYPYHSYYYYHHHCHYHYHRYSGYRFAGLLCEVSWISEPLFRHVTVKLGQAYPPRLIVPRLNLLDCTATSIKIN